MKSRYAIPREDLKDMLIGFAAGGAALAFSLFAVLSIRLVGG